MKLLLDNSNNNNKVKVKKELEDVISEEIVRRTLKRALRNYSTLQVEDGFWPGDYGGPLFLLPSLVLPFPSLYLFILIKIRFIYMAMFLFLVEKIHISIFLFLTKYINLV